MADFILLATEVQDVAMDKLEVKTKHMENGRINGRNQNSILDVSSQNLQQLPESNIKFDCIVRLILDFNDLAELPQDFGHFFLNVEHVSISGNQLSSIPDSFGTLHSLKTLDLTENNITQLSEKFCDLKNLEELKLTGNSLQELPVNFGKIDSVRTLLLDENKLKCLPNTFGLLSRLETLDASNNQIQELPEGMGSLASLRVLNLSSNNLKEIPESLGHLEHLQTVDLSNNSILFLMTSFKSTNSIQKLYVDYNLLKTLPQWIEDLTQLVEFSLKDNQLQYKPLTEKFGTTSTKLRLLDMRGNFINKLPESLGNLTSLKFIHFGSPLDELDRSSFQNGNWLLAIPDSICELIYLRELHLDENQLHEIPESIGDLVNLEILDLALNFIHELPESFGQLKSLRKCMLTKNSLQLLPSSIGNLKCLVDLRVDSNALAELPESFAELTQLVSLDLFNNKLTKVPDALQHLSSLRRFDMDKNPCGIQTKDIPHICLNVTYAARDTTQRDSWRGRTRGDLLIPDSKIIKISHSEDTLTDDQEPDKDETQPAPYSQSLFEIACRKNMSLWRTHSGPQEREVPQSREEEPEEDEEDGLDDDYYEPPSEIASLEASSHTSSSQERQQCPPFDRSRSPELVEDWDAESAAYFNQMENVPEFPEETESEEIIDHIFVPSDIHALKTCRYLGEFTVEEGQFSDAL